MDQEPDRGDRGDEADDVYASTAPPDRAPRGRSTLSVILWSLAGILVLSGIVVAGVVLAFVVALNQYASNK